MIVNGTDDGLTLASGATLSIEDGGLIELVFNDAGLGFEWVGNHETALSDYFDAGDITISLSQVLINQGYTAGVKFEDGSTFVTALIPEPGSLALLALGLGVMLRRRAHSQGL